MPRCVPLHTVYMCMCVCIYELMGRSIIVLQAAVQEMDNQDWRGRRMKVAFATSTGDGGGRPAYGGGGGDRGGDRGGGAREGDAPVSQNLFVANIPPHIKMSELEAYFEQFGAGNKHVRVMLFIDVC